ncbi:hypothetical protein GCM10027341_27240 [Spirosoma knui]
MLSRDGMNLEDAINYLTRFGNRLPATFYKFDGRDPYKKEVGIKQRDQALSQRDRQIKIAARNSDIAARNSDINAAKLILTQQAMQGFNAYGASKHRHDRRQWYAHGRTRYGLR